MFDTVSSQTLRKRYERTVGNLRVEVNLSLDQDTNTAGMQIRLSGAAGAAEIVQVLQAIINKIKTDFGV